MAQRSKKTTETRQQETYRESCRPRKVCADGKLKRLTGCAEAPLPLPLLPPFFAATANTTLFAALGRSWGLKESDTIHSLSLGALSLDARSLGTLALSDAQDTAGLRQRHWR